ncbi:MAG TPA: cysteine--tRNA ligase [Candidatus Nitrosopolaris sp.]|nr:cysteine--tRNA ligase [Candidatus Nitrosopolaris sp.]
MKVYNTLTGRLDDVNHDGAAPTRIYLCGVTVYDKSHIGHARTIVVFDILRRYLLSKNCSVEFIQNFTDVDDKIINRAIQEGSTAEEVASRYIQNYFKDFSSLNVLVADRYPRVTEHIREIIDLISALMIKGYAYLSPNGIYFRVRSFSGYGKLSKKSIEDLVLGARIEIDQSKEDPLDFALWKFHSDPPVWDSPWGVGRPGWHVECSAMALKYFKSPFEIHGGGYDLVFPHHENEIAQSESFSGKQFAKIWMHSGLVTVNSEKMSKSLGNIVTIHDALKRWGPNSMRIYSISVHYSKPLDYSEKLLNDSRQKWRQIETCACELHFAMGNHGCLREVELLSAQTLKAFETAMEDNLNTSLAFTVFLKLVTELNRYAAEEKLTADMAKIADVVFNNIMKVLGLRIIEANDIEKKEIESLIGMRDQLREQQKFYESDAIRKKLFEEYSVELIDHKKRTIWSKTEEALRLHLVD